MSAPDGATWRSGYATVCKTVYTSSILVVASIQPLETSQQLRSQPVPPNQLATALLPFRLSRAAVSA